MSIQEDIWEVCKDHVYTLVSTGIYRGSLRMKVTQKHSTPYDIVAVTGWDDNGNSPIHFLIGQIKEYTMDKGITGTTMEITFHGGAKVTLNQ